MTRALIALALALGLGAFTAKAQTSVSLTVPSSATGSFGTPGEGNPMVAAITVSQPGTIIIQAAGTWSVGPLSYLQGIGPNGVTQPAADRSCCQDPLQTVVGIGKGHTSGATGALIGAFVPSSVTSLPGFQASDSTKALSAFGISPNALFFVGSYTTFEAPGAGTLYLGDNDANGFDDSGSLSVTVTSTSP